MDWIDLVEVKHIMNIPLKEGDSFFKKQLYSYKFPRKPKAKTIIEVEHYEGNIIVISFYKDGAGTDKNRYKLRHNYPSILVLRILQSCLKIFLELNSDNSYTLVFNASDDVDDYKAFNHRMSSYTKFLEIYYPNYEEHCFYSGYMNLNTFYCHHKDNPNHEIARSFFEEYCEKVKAQFNNSEESSK
ncbi:hypothetical protein U0038_17580 [Sphingobacterium spiritivorum]|uniref:Uncharacterized protein n=1 Tax=Sphingobacterium spiritivorum ATCC 33861 TaxID=525373 RepID=D7VN44_SPHSI|nr:hypothetical protein [Sphingobacterium spiritivorum]EFK57341.1 hypothetical protein HMPREF0766_12414 [Sphingobacterium spiritivorum ATCC 33861]QQT36579.1 hypothetical protein I6J01_03870 [Sphingobacterium spiritivorum]WQD33330.1 hypothetical protein U0038_17580 [Sphingobacterium spiritivorum]SUJ22103.1 Uncharacterised protein [Sphingobacterium spiritivorum]